MAALTLTAMALAACSARTPPALQGYIEAEFVDMAAAASGRLERLNVMRGQRVEANAPLFTLEATAEEATARQAQQQLDAARAQLADLRTGGRAAEVDVVAAQLAQAQAAAGSSKAAIVRDQAQYQAGGISQAQLDGSRARAQIDAARVQELQSQLMVAKLPARADRIKAQAAVVAAADAALAQADWRLAQKSVRAPAAGAIYDTLYRIGEWVPAGGPVVRLLPPQNIKVRFFVTESILGSVVPGRRIGVHCDGCAGEITATIDYVSPEAEYTPPVIYSDENRAKLVYMVEARPSAADAVRLHPGQPVAVRLQ